MTKDELITRLKKAEELDRETYHIQADDLLLEFINDPEITAAYNAMNKWYS
jgi:hypothetical protein